MKAPYKIYVREYPDGIARFWERKKKEDVVATITHEYIRKDALMEMLNKKLQESADRLDFHANQAYAEVIDKLNSL